ncbi:putative integral membrane protein [Leptolyngbya sp. PCC 7375]|nr:putative integral membrane protein [Leptolyngbya sp. PCC 7375]
MNRFKKVKPTFFSVSLLIITLLVTQAVVLPTPVQACFLGVIGCRPGRSRNNDDGEPKQGIPTNLQICNRTGEQVHVARAHYSNNSWYSKGWMQIGPQGTEDDCKLLSFGLDYEGDVLIYGESSAVRWGRDSGICVDPNYAFEVRYSSRLSRCEDIGYAHRSAFRKRVSPGNNYQSLNY